MWWHMPVTPALWRPRPILGTSQLRGTLSQAEGGWEWSSVRKLRGQSPAPQTKTETKYQSVKCFRRVLGTGDLSSGLLGRLCKGQASACARFQHENLPRHSTEAPCLASVGAECGHCRGRLWEADCPEDGWGRAERKHFVGWRTRQAPGSIPEPLGPLRSKVYTQHSGEEGGLEWAVSIV